MLQYTKLSPAKAFALYPLQQKRMKKYRVRIDLVHQNESLPYMTQQRLVHFYSEAPHTPKLFALSICSVDLVLNHSNNWTRLIHCNTPNMNEFSHLY